MGRSNAASAIGRHVSIFDDAGTKNVCLIVAHEPDTN